KCWRVLTNNLGGVCFDYIQKVCTRNMGNCRKMSCRENEKDIGSCGPGFYCCKRS
uniref:Beta-defensin-like domain-containing protein n=1 Tax=Podarcis muralis TaxID=64176 RepID=A0A670HMG5_PODMU